MIMDEKLQSDVTDKVLALIDKADNTKVLDHEYGLWEFSDEGRIARAKAFTILDMVGLCFGSGAREAVYAGVLSILNERTRRNVL